MAEKMRECPSCGLEFEDARAEECPYCGYEFPPEKSSVKLVALLMALLLAWPIFKLVTWLL